MKKSRLILTVILLACSTCTFAKGVMVEMFQMKKQLTALTQATDANEFQQSAQAFIDVAEKAKMTMPASLGNDQEAFKGYQAGMQEVIDVAKQAETLAQQGKLDEAKAKITQLNEMKRHYHSEYK